MGRTSNKHLNPSELFGRIVEQAKELTSKPVENISESLTNKSLSHIDEHYSLVTNETMEEVLQLLKEQENYLNKLTETVAGNEGEIKVISQHLTQQEEFLTSGLERLNEDSKIGTSDLKDLIENVNAVDYSVFEEAFKEGSDKLVSQQRAHSVEMDRMMMSLKTSIEKNIEKTKGVLEKKIESTTSQGAVTGRVTMIFTIVNLVCLIGYIIYDVLI